MYPRILSLSLLAIAVGAAETGTDVPTIIITADRRETELERSGVSIEVVTDDDLRQRGSPTESVDWFRELPGIGVFPRYGGFDGGVPDVRVRGLESTYTQVLIDGIPVNNPTSIGNDLSFAFLSPAGIERVEVLKGPQSGLYGSRAVGGVAGMRTIRPTATHEQRLRITGGSFGTVAVAAQTTGPIGDSVGFALAIEGLRSDGISSTTPNADGDPDGYEADGVERLSYHARLEWRPDVDTTVYAAALGSRVDQQFDDFYYNGVTFATLLQETAQDRIAGNTADSDRFAVGVNHVEGRLEWAGDVAWTTLAHQNRSINGQNYFGGATPDPVTITYRGDEVFASGRFGYQPSEDLHFGAGIDTSWQQGSQDRTDLGSLWTDQQRAIGSWLQAGWSTSQTELDAVLRLDHLSGFGNHASGRIAGAVLDGSRTTKLHASIANGFRGPSLYERFGSERGGFSYQGNPDLTAETFLGYDAGVVWRPTAGLTYAATWFRTGFKDKMEYLFNPITFVSSRANASGKSSVTGAEFSAEVIDIASSGIDLSGDYTRQRSSDPEGEHLAYDPQDRGGVRLTARQEATSHLQVWESLRIDRVGPYFSGANDAGRVDGYTLLSAAAGVSFDQRWDLSLRIENLTDERYLVTSAYGVAYATLPRSVFVTLTGKF